MRCLLSKTPRAWDVVIIIIIARAFSFPCRDIKLENILLDERSPPRVKIADFGYAKADYFDSIPRTRVGRESTAMSRDSLETRPANFIVILVC